MSSEQKPRKQRGKVDRSAMFPVAPARHDAPEGYAAVLGEFKERIRCERLRVVLASNAAMVLLYWDIGERILDKQHHEGWGARVIDRLSADLQEAFPDMKGFSPRNLKYMRRFAEVWPEREIVQAVLAQLTWYHNIALLEKLPDADQRLWYARQTLQHGWSRNILALQIEARAIERHGKAQSNFALTLPPPDSDMATQVFKDPYLFDFLGTASPRREKELEQGLMDHLQKFLIELGQGFAFVGRQVHLELGDQDFYLDLLFYHARLHCYVVIELKTGDFEPEHAGKLNFYIKAIDEQLRGEGDQPTIGLLLCKNKDRLVAEYALSDIHKPMGVSEYTLSHTLPESLRDKLPSIEAIERELGLDGLNDEGAGV